MTNFSVRVVHGHASVIYRILSIEHRGAYKSSHTKRYSPYSTEVLTSKIGKNTVDLSTLNEIGNAGRARVGQGRA